MLWEQFYFALKNLVIWAIIRYKSGFFHQDSLRSERRNRIGLETDGRGNIKQGCLIRLAEK